MTGGEPNGRGPGGLLAATAAPLILAAVGTVHPHHLTVATARHWTVLHVVLLPVFPLLATGLVVPIINLVSVEQHPVPPTCSSSTPLMNGPKGVTSNRQLNSEMLTWI